MSEYEGHMTRVNDNTNHVNNCYFNTYYLPHHEVIKEDSTTTKLRVVFDASAKTSNGVSFDNILMVGPTIQRELFDFILGNIM